MNGIEALGVWIIIYVAIAILGIFLALAPLFCWIHLRKIRRQQAENVQRVNAHLYAMRRSLEEINDTLSKIAFELEARK